MHRISAQRLKQFCLALMVQEHVPAAEAELIADHLIEAELCGVSSHGVSRVAIYLQRLHAGVVNAAWSYEIEQEYPSSILWNAHNSMGMVTGVHAMELCISKARESGCCLVGVNHSNHFGMAGYYAKMAAQAGMIGLCGTNAPPNIAPWGSYRAYLGTNPLAISAPSHQDPLVLDMAPSVVAMGKVILAAKLGKPIPEGWAITADGRPTTDPNEGMKGTVLPIGGPKGYGLALFMDIMCGLLSDAEFGPYLGNMWNDFQNPQNIGHIFFSVDISKFTNLEKFKNRLDQMISDIKSLPTNPGVDEILMPGELELKRRKEALEKGICLSDVVFQELVSLGEKYQIDISLQA